MTPALYHVPNASHVQEYRPFGRLIPPALVIYACMLPRELTFEVLGIAFFPYRTALVLMLPYFIFKAIRTNIRPSAVDFLVLFAAVWAVIALTVVENFASASVVALADAIDFILAYFVGRVSIRDGRDLKNLVPLIIPGLLLSTLIMAAESFSHQIILRSSLGQLFGRAETFMVEERLGLMRATGPFLHPILGGVFLSSFLPLIWYLIERPWLKAIGIVGITGFFFSLSSTGFLAFIVATGLIVASTTQRVTRLPIFVMLGVGLGALFTAVALISENGLFSFIVRRLTLSSGTGYFRMLIWEHAGAEVLNHPIFGIGTREYSRPAWMISSSVDAHWLLLALRYGFPHMIPSLLVMLIATFVSLRGTLSLQHLDRMAGYALGFSLVAIIFTGLSVSIWEGVDAWMTMLTGMAISFGQHVSTAGRAVFTPMQFAVRQPELHRA